MFVHSRLLGVLIRIKFHRRHPAKGLDRVSHTRFSRSRHPSVEVKPGCRAHSSIGKRDGGEAVAPNFFGSESSIGVASVGILEAGSD